MNDKRRWNGWHTGTAVSAVILLLSGCSGYRLGSMLPPEIETVHVPVFINETTEPNIEFDTTQATIQRIQTDGSLKIASKENADATLQVTLTDYHLAPTAYEKERATAADEYRVTVTARVLLTRTGTGEVLAEHPRIRGEATFPLAGNLTSSKRAALPFISRDLAHDIVELIVEYW